MSDRTAHASRSVTKATKITCGKWWFVILVAFVFVVPAFAAKPLRRGLAVARAESVAGGGGTERWPPAVSQQAPPPTQAQQRPVFRGGTHFVRVDAYPLKDGKIIAGLTPQDFEVFEDGTPQSIDSFDFISFETFTPEAERVEPQTREESFQMAADPRNRVFVIVVDLPRTANPPDPRTGVRGINTDILHIQRPLVGFLDRVIGPQDLFGFLTTRNTAKDLVLMRKTLSVQEQIRDLFRSGNIDRDEADDLDLCDNGAMALKQRFRDDQTYTALETLVVQLGAIREERKSVIFVANSITRERSMVNVPSITNGEIPRIGIANGRIGIGTVDGMPQGNRAWCSAQVQRLAAIDFDQRYRDLTGEARRQNVSFYSVAPEGLTPHRPDDNIIALAENTDGIAIVNTNDLNAGMTRIADDLQAYYVLGYYTTNTKFDGGLRKITVKLKGTTIRARREYRAPTEADIAALASPKAAVPPAQRPPAIIGEPIAYRIALRQPPERSARLEFERSDRLRAVWPVLAPLDRREARMLDSTGKPLAIELPLSENESAKTVTVELPLAPFARGVYSIELTAGSGSAVERRRLTFTMK